MVVVIGTGMSSILPPLSVNNYPEMLLKLGWSAGLVSFGCLLVLRRYVSPIAEFSSYIDGIVPKEIAELVHIPGSVFGVAILAIIIAVVAYAIKLHDRLSDLLRLRAEFDVHYILYPLAIASGATLSSAQFSKIRQQRNSLMGAAFYQYASSTKPTIDTHTITQALTNWSWFWACLEAMTLLLISASVLAVYDAWKPAVTLCFISVLLMLAMRFFRLQSAGYAESQAEQILRDEDRRSAVAALFNAL